MTLILALCGLASAQTETEFAGAEVPADDTAIVAEESKTDLSAELGGLWTSGNAVLYAVNGGLTFGRRWDRNKLAGLAGANLGAAVTDADASGNISPEERDAGYTENSRRVFGEVRYDRYVTDRDSVYFLAGAFHDIFAGYDLRSHEQIGYSRQLIDEEKAQLRGEVGFDWAQEFYRSTPEAPVDPDYQNIFAGRVLAGGSYQFNDNVSFTDTFEVYVNVVQPEDLRILNTGTLTSTLSSNLSLKLSHILIFDNVPVEGFAKFDQTTAVTLVATIL